jgi:hypothetical protein
MLSKYQPISLIIYSNSELMGIPGEIIFKIYRKDLEEKKFDTLEK